MDKTVAQLYQPLFLYIKKRINNNEDAEDITQDVFLKLSRSDESKIVNTRNWVYSIAKNTITDYYRKKKILFDEIRPKIISYISP